MCLKILRDQQCPKYSNPPIKPNNQSYWDHIFPRFWCVTWTLPEALNLYMHDLMHCAAATWLANNCMNEQACRCKQVAGECIFSMYYIWVRMEGLGSITSRLTGKPVINRRLEGSHYIVDDGSYRWDGSTCSQTDPGILTQASCWRVCKKCLAGSRKWIR